MELAARGHELHIVTALPWYQHHAIEPGWNGQLVRHEDTEWGRITRVHPFPTDKREHPGPGRRLRRVHRARRGRERHRPQRARRGARHVAAADPRSRRVGASPGPPGRRSCSTSRTSSPTWPSSSALLTNRRVIAAASWLERADLPAAPTPSPCCPTTWPTTSAPSSASATGRGAPGRTGGKVRVIPNFVDTERIRPGPARQRLPRTSTASTARGSSCTPATSGSPSRSTWCSTRRRRWRPRTTSSSSSTAAARPGPTSSARPPASTTCASSTCSPRSASPRSSPPPTSTWSRCGGAWPGRACRRSSTRSWPPVDPIVASVDPGTEVARTVTGPAPAWPSPPDDAEAFTKAVRRLLDDADEAAGDGRRGPGVGRALAVPGGGRRARTSELFTDARCATCNSPARPAV